MDANVGHLVLSDVSMAAKARHVLSSVASLDDLLQLELGMDYMIRPLLVQAILRADQAFLDVIKRYTKVPIDARAMSMTLPQDDYPQLCGLAIMACSADLPVQVLRMALELGADPNEVLAEHEKHQWTAAPAVIHCVMALGSSAAALEQAEAVPRLLVERGAILNAVDSAGRGLLHYCATFGTRQSSSEGRTFEHLFRLALERGADPNLIAAAPRLMITPADTAVAAACQAWGTDPGPHGQETMHKIDNALRLLQILKDTGAEMRPEASTLHYPGTAKGRTRGATSMATNFLCDAVRHDCGPIVTWILQNTAADVNFRLDKTCPTYLFVAASRGAVNCAKLLLEAGADPMVKDKEGQTAAQDASARLKSALRKPATDSSVKRLQTAELLRQAEAEWAASHPAAGDGDGSRRDDSADGSAVAGGPS